MQVEIPAWLPKIGIKTGKLLDVKKVKSLEKVPALAGTVIVDLDGVLCCRGRENETWQNTRRVFNLLRILGEADEVIFSTARFEIGKREKDKRKKIDPSDGPVGEEVVREKRRKRAVSHCPFLTGRSEDFLEEIILRRNPNCVVRFDATAKKYTAKNEKTLTSAKEVLDRGGRLTMIGSGFFDKRVANKITRENQANFGRVTLYNLGAGLI